MRRREFIAGLAGATMLPIAVFGQSSATRVVAFLSSGTRDSFGHLLPAFREGISEGGFVDAENVALEIHAARGDYSRFPSLAAELARRQIAVIVANGGTAAAIAAKGATSAIPIVFFVSGDPVANGLAHSLNQPGGNITGLGFLSIALGPKCLELLRDLMPNAVRIAVLSNPTNLDAATETRSIEQASRVLGRDTMVIEAATEQQLDEAFARIARSGAHAILVGGDAFYTNQRQRLVALGARYELPMIYDRRDFPDAGGLISYGFHRTDAYRQLGILAGRILKGEKAGQLPVLQPTRFELVINLKTAKALGIEVPLTMLYRADEVIE
jgi:putative tryptophan/tyrosine transport system substrate-binding protein